MLRNFMLQYNINLYSLKVSFIAGLVSGLVFAPIFFVPALLCISLLCLQVSKAHNIKQAALYGLIFGVGHFLVGVYWIAIGVTVYIEDFWWLIPFALFGLPLILACFIALQSAISWFFRYSKYYHFCFCVSWVLCEWLRSWLFTGLPWNLLGYSLAFSDILIQPASLFGIYGLSFMVIYISSSFYSLSNVRSRAIVSIILICSAGIFGFKRLEQNPTAFSNIKVRLVQPSIKQDAKWDAAEFWRNLRLHTELSKTPSAEVPDLILWSEAALVVPYEHPAVKAELLKMLGAVSPHALLITGGVSSNNKSGDELQIYTTLLAVSASGDKVFEYNKAHLVPFGEYVPLKSILPIQKLTPGLLDYTEGTIKPVYIKQLNLNVRALICYEAIFPNEVRIANQDIDLIINATNDAWYGDSFGPYQHLHISRLRAVENGIPLLRVANNGISAIIDPVGRILAHLELNERNVINGVIPSKHLISSTLYSMIGDASVIIIIILVLMIQFSLNILLKCYILIDNKA